MGYDKWPIRGFLHDWSIKRNWPQYEFGNLNLDQILDRTSSCHWWVVVKAKLVANEQQSSKVDSPWHGYWLKMEILLDLGFQMTGLKKFVMLIHLLGVFNDSRLTGGVRSAMNQWCCTAAYFELAWCSTLGRRCASITSWWWNSSYCTALDACMSSLPKPFLGQKLIASMRHEMDGFITYNSTAFESPVCSGEIALKPNPSELERPRRKEQPER